MRTIVNLQNEFGPLTPSWASGCRRGWMLSSACALAFWAAGSALAQPFSLPFYEPFPTALVSTLYTNQTLVLGYENNEELGQGVVPEANGALCSSNMWTFGNSISSSSARILSTNGQSGLQYPGLTNVDAVYQTGLLSLYIKDTSSTKDRAVPLSIPASSTNAPLSVYASVLFSIQTNQYISPTGPVPIFGLTTNTGGSSVNHAGAVIYMNNSLELLLGKGTNEPDTHQFTSALTISNTYLLVLRYKYNPGGPGTNADEVDLWVDPVALGGNAVVPPPTISTTNASNLSSNFFGAVAVLEVSAPPVVYLDEIRVATNWGGVTPGTPAPGNIYAVTGGGAGCGNTGFNVGLSGADANVTYYLYTNGVPTGQSISGPAASFGLQTATALYTVLGSNTVNNNVGWMAGGAAVSLLTAPVITTQPAPVLVTSGELAAFSVAASGGGETYQWYKHGVALTNGAEFSGVQSATLVIFPATAADVATSANGYYVVINNACGTGAVISTTNALTLDSPANLIWAGDGVSNLWDVAASLNWNTNTTVFNYGDNVTFDDSSGNGTVTLASSYLSPSSVTINGFYTPYVFTGPGALVGAGSLVMNSSDTLTLETPNSMSGGLIVSNGQVIFDGGTTLGTGPITLAGGELTAANIGLVTVDNPIIVTGSGSTLSASATGGQPLVITNTITGVSGNLTFLNTANKNGQPTIYLGSPFTFGLPVTLSPGSSGLGILLAASNAVGSQVWNNQITGAGELQRDGAGGATLLNDTNNYTGDESGENSQGTLIGTLLTDGQLGVGVNSTNDINGNLVGALGSAALAIDTRGAGTPQLFASGGPRVVSNAITFYSNVVGSAWVINGTNELALAGDIDMNETNRALDVSNTAPTLLSGSITDDGYGVGWTIRGPGSLYLDGVNTYTGGTTNTGGLLAGTGSVAGPMVVASGGTLGGGDPSSIGSFTINGSLNLGGNLFIRVNKSLSTSNDSITVGGGLTNTGAGLVTVSNAGPALAVGDTFTLFSNPLVNGGAMTVTGGSAHWNNHLAVDGSISVASIIVAPPPPPHIVSASISGGNLVFSGTNGTEGLTYYVFASTNLALPLGSWTAVSTNVFGTGGTFSVTNALGAGSEYFVLKVLP